jgi:hypothetical protein
MASHGVVKVAALVAGALRARRIGRDQGKAWATLRLPRRSWAARSGAAGCACIYMHAHLPTCRLHLVMFPAGEPFLPSLSA